MNYTSIDYLVGSLDPKTKHKPNPRFWVEYESPQKKKALTYLLKANNKKLTILKRITQTTFESV